MPAPRGVFYLLNSVTNALGVWELNNPGNALVSVLREWMDLGIRELWIKMAAHAMVIVTYLSRS